MAPAQRPSAFKRRDYRAHVSPSQVGGPTGGKLVDRRREIGAGGRRSAPGAAADPQGEEHEPGHEAEGARAATHGLA